MSASLGASICERRVVAATTYIRSAEPYRGEHRASKDKGHQRASSVEWLQTENSIKRRAAPDREESQVNESCEERSVFHRVLSPPLNAPPSVELSVMS